MVDEPALAILNSQGSRETTILDLQRKFIFDMQVDPDWQKWQTKRSKLGAKDFETSEFHQDTWNGYLMLGFVSAHIAWNAISNLELQLSYQTLRSAIVLPSATTLSNVCRRERALTVDAIKNQLQSQNKVSLALDVGTSTDKLAITSFIAYYLDQNWALREVHLAFNEVDRLFFSTFVY